ncbi:MAG: hypothetical protein ACP5O1_04735 [Phycisphaerae bacterium]
MKEDKPDFTKSDERTQTSGNRDSDDPKRNRDNGTGRDESAREQPATPKPECTPTEKDYAPDESDSDKDPGEGRSVSRPPVPGHGAESPLMSLGQHGGAYDDKNLDDPHEF